MSCPLAGNIAPGIELEGMHIPTLVQSTFKAIESGCHNGILRELIQRIYNSITEIVSSYIQPKPFLVDLQGVSSC